MKNILSMSAVTKRLLRGLSLFAVALIIVSGAVMALIACHLEMRNLEQRFRNIERGYVDVIRTALWNEDSQTMKIVLDGICRIPGIQSAHIHVKDGITYKSGNESIPSGINRFYPLSYTYDDRQIPLGVLHVQGSEAFLRAQILHATLLEMAIQTVTILIIFMIYLFSIYRHVVRRVLRITEYTAALSLENLDRPFVADQEIRNPDELDELAVTIDRMREELHRAIERRKVVEEDLRRHRDELEVMVASRTNALKEANEQLQQEIEEKSRLEQEQEKLIASLREEMSKVKKLSGLLPICASCKKIRDDDGYWNEVEAYIRDRSEAEFSHGICPECARKLYPDLKIYK